jgi:hypothetical protein
MRKPYCCEASRDLFEQYYAKQQRGGGDFPVHVGVYRQRGHGVGSVFAGLFRRILPMLKSLAPQALRTGADFIDDISKGKSWKDAAFSRLPQTLSKLAFGDANQSGSGVQRKRTARRRKKRCKRDIFS